MSPEPKYASMTPDKRKLIDDFFRRLVRMKHEACILGLYKTMHAIGDATNQAGYELAEILEAVEREHVA